jgi:hypothetical protein
MDADFFLAVQGVKDAVAGKAGTREQLQKFVELWAHATNYMRVRRSIDVIRV